MRLLWAVDAPVRIGGGYGFSVHRIAMKEALRAAGVTVTVDPADDYDLAVHVVRPDFFRPIPGRNVLLTQVEMTAPMVWSDTIKEATAIVTACSHSKQAIEEYYQGTGQVCPPVFVCREGIDEKVFRPYDRQPPAPGEAWRFLWAGNADDRRKGAGLAVDAFKAWLASGRAPANVTLTVKSTSDEQAPAVRYYPWINGTFLGPIDFLIPGIPLLIHDSRNLPVQELADLYGSSHAFIMPSFAEGFGLTIVEAMATGCPTAATLWSAMTDYLDTSVAFPITDFKMAPFWKYERGGTAEQAIAAGIPPDYYGARCSQKAIVAAMQEIVDDYPAALERGLRASERMASQYTWRQAAEKFLAICERERVSKRRWA